MSTPCLVIDCEQHSPEWFAARTGRITMSRAKDARAKLKNGAPSQAQLDYMAELAIERVSGSMVDRFVTPAMKRGTELEDEARQLYEARTGAFVDEVGICIRDGFGGSPDGLVDADGLIEIKCPANPFKLAQLYIEHDPAEYMDQMQGLMWITGRQWCDLVVYSPGLPLKVQRVPRDDAHIEALLADLHVFAARVDEYTAQLRKAAA